MSDAVDQWFALNRARILSDLFEYLSIDTSVGKEADAFPFLERYLSGAGFDVRREGFHPRLKDHPAFSPHPLSICSSSRQNLRAVYSRPAEGRLRTLFNCHIDVVPAGLDFEDAFAPIVREERVFGRGACDAKGNLVMLVETLRFLEAVGIPIRRNVLIDLPVEEEVGGNGTLSTILHGVSADEVVVMEPTSLKVHRGHRGCLTARLIVHGQPRHMGSADHASSAIRGAVSIIRELEQLEEQLLRDSGRAAGFEVWKRPVQINVGTIAGGEWAGTIPHRCELTANVGFLPIRSMEQVESMIERSAGQALRDFPNLRVEVEFHSGLRNGAYLLPEQAGIVQDLAAAITPPPLQTYGWHVSCDAHYYARVAGLPTAIFGAGDLGVAHSAGEYLSLSEMLDGMNILARFFSADQTC
jgi:acetylornithine deacetylase